MIFRKTAQAALQTTLQTTSQICLKKKGFTLIELIVVIAILAILAAVAVPAFSAISDNARAEADNASLKILNDATTYYGLTKITATTDAFDSITTDTGRMQELITKGYLNEIVTPQQRNVSFIWDIPSQKWLTGGAVSSAVSTKVSGAISNAVSSTASSGSTAASSGGIAVTGVTLSQTTMTLAATTGGGMNDGPKTLTAAVSPANATNKAVKWSSSNTAAATVDANGVVRFVSPGTAIITVTTADGGKTASCTVKTQW